MGAACQSGGCRQGGSTEDAATALSDEVHPIFDDGRPKAASEDPSTIEPHGWNRMVSISDKDLMRQVSMMSRQLSPTVGDTMHLAQAAKVANGTGFFVGLDTRSSNALKVLEHYGLKDLETPEDIAEQLQALRLKVICDKEFHGENVVGVMMDSTLMTSKVDGRQKVATYLWKEKQVVPFLSLHGLASEQNGVELIQIEDMEDQLSAASTWRVHGVKARCMIRAPNKTGIQAAIDQQFEIANLVRNHDLVPAVHLEVSIDAQDKASCEELLLKVLLSSLDALEGEAQVLLVLTLPNMPNIYLPLAHHPRVIRLLALSGGYSRDDSCTMLVQNVCMAACFSRALLEGLRASMSADEFSATLRRSCERIAHCCKETPQVEQQLAKLCTQNGLIVTLDERAIASGEALESLGHTVPDGGWTDAEVADRAGRMTWRIVSDLEFKGTKILAAILSERLIDSEVDGQTLPDFLWTHRQVVPMLQLEKLMQDGELRSDFDAILARAKQDGYFAVQIRTARLRKTDGASMRTRVLEMFTYADKIRSAGLVPSLNMEVATDSPKKEDIEHLLFDEVVLALGNLKPGEHVILSVTLPAEANLYLPLTQNPCVIRVAGRYRGASRQAGCGHLAKCFGITSAFGAAFTEGLRITLDEAAFSAAIRQSSDELYHASTYVPTKEIQAAKVSNTDGFIVAMDQSGARASKILQDYGVSETELVEKVEVKINMQRMLERFLSNPALNGSMVVAVTLPVGMLSHQLANRPLPKYVWEVKQIAPFVGVDKGLRTEKDGVCMMAEVPELEKVLAKALKLGAVGAKTRSSIKAPSRDGICQLVRQQIRIARKVLAKGMLPLIQIAVELDARDKARCEQQLVLQLLAGMKVLKAGEQILLWLSLPDEPHVYMPLLAHPNVARLVGLSGGHDNAESCRRLSQTVGMIAGFGRAMFEGLTASQPEEEFTATLDKTSKAMFRVSRSVTARTLQMARLAKQDGIIAALDSSGETLAGIMQHYGSCGANDSESMVATEARTMRKRIMTSSVFNGSRVIACVIPEDMLAESLDRMLCARYLWEVKKVIPFLRIDTGLMPQSRGVCLMNDLERVKAGFDKALAFGCVGIKVRSVIVAADSEGIKAAVDQHFEVAKGALAKKLVPILQIEVDPKAADRDRARCEQLLRGNLVSSLRHLDDKDKVIMQITLPAKANSFSAFTTHANVLRTVALSGGTSATEACKQLSENEGLIGAFGRAIVQNLSAKQTELEFTRGLDAALDDIFLSSLRGDASLEGSAALQHVSSMRSTSSSKRSLKDVAQKVSTLQTVSNATSGHR
mmetsp:Transcript_21964/g.55974  ORF Transcript_21964/g.55974 Transcript_21964/m.55974 type:complete len:1308 (+) Transcript_21964:126-4049(+)